jgi:hypothetical protein
MQCEARVTKGAGAFWFVSAPNSGAPVRPITAEDKDQSP